MGIMESGVEGRNNDRWHSIIDYKVYPEYSE